MKKIFLTFADARLCKSSARIVKQAKALDFFDEIIAFDETNLDVNFARRFESKLVPGTRGFGYWCWKPQVILQVLNQLEEGDVLQYTDVGCHFNSKGLKRLSEYFTMASKSDIGVLAFQGVPPKAPLVHDGRKLLDLRDFKWSKGDLLDYLNVRDNLGILSSQTIGAGIVFIRKCESSVSLINKWLQVIEHDFSLLDDTPSKSSNSEFFVEHRHDQAVFSLLCKLNNVKTISAYEYWYPSRDSFKPDWHALSEFPVHAKRDKDLGYRDNAKMFCLKVINKIKKIMRFS